MRAIDYGMQNFGGSSYKNTKSNIVVFNEAINLGNEENQTSELDDLLFHYKEIEFTNEEQTKFSYIVNGELISGEQFDYIKNSGIITWKIVDSSFPIETQTPGVYTLVKLFEIEEKFFLQLPGRLETVEIIASGKGKKNKPLILLNEILNNKSTSVVVFISDDGVKLERAYQNIECYNNEVVLFIENDFGSNLFGSVLRIKLGANITENSNFPASQTAKIINAYKLGIDIDTVTLSKAIKEEIENNEGVIHYIKKRFWATDKIVSVPVNFAFNKLEKAFDSISSGINSIKLEENKWRYYNEDGTKNEEENLLFFNLNDFEKLEAKSKTNYHKKMFSGALKQLNNKNDEWKANIKTLKFDKENKYLNTYINDSINKIDNILKPTKDFLGNPEALAIENNKDTLIALNAFLVGLINGIIEIIKGLFDILSLLCQLFEGIRKGTSYLAQNLASLFSMFFEGIENFLDTLKNLFTKENLKALLQFIVQLPKLFLQLSIEGTNYLLNTDLKVPIDAFGYYIGYFIGMLVDIIISAIFTGGAKTIADVLKIISKQFTEIYKFAKSTLKYTAKVATNSIEYIIDLLAKIKNGAKNIKPFLDEILESLRTLLGAIPKQLTEYFTKFGITIQKVPQQVLYSGIPTKVGDDIYALIKNGKEIFRGTKKEIENIGDYLKILEKADAEKYLLELANIKFIDDAIKKLKIEITIPKNTLNATQSIKKLENIFQSLKNKIPPKHYNPKKEALKKLGIKLKATKNGLCADFEGTKYLYPAKGKEKNIIKIKLTGNDYYDFKLANDLAGLSKKPLGYTWHHLDDYDPITNTCTMQLVKIKYHRKTNPHFGSVELVKQFFNSKDLYISRNKLKKIKL
jgi:hypothetical protein